MLAMRVVLFLPFTTVGLIIQGCKKFENMIFSNVFVFKFLEKAVMKIFLSVKDRNQSEYLVVFHKEFLFHMPDIRYVHQKIFQIKVFSWTEFFA